MEYIVKKLPENAGCMPLDGVFTPEGITGAYAALEEATVAEYAWPDEGYRPEVHARVGWNEKGLHVLMYANEPTIRAQCAEIGGKVCVDSCMEFFFMPFPEEDRRYFNAEMNPLGTLHLGLGEGRGNRVKIREQLPEGFEIISLPGHFFDMAGFRTPDDIVYLADCLSSRETLEKYRIGFIYDVGAYLETLEKVSGMTAKAFVPSHAEPAENIAELARYNIDTVNEIADTICRLCTEPVCFEVLLGKLFGHYGLKMSFEQYALVGSTVRSYLTWLKDCGRLEGYFEDNMLLWKRI